MTQRKVYATDSNCFDLLSDDAGGGGGEVFVPLWALGLVINLLMHHRQINFFIFMK